MNFKITGDGIAITSALREHAHTQLGRVLQNCTAVPSVEVILKRNNHADKDSRNTATVNVTALGKIAITRTETSNDMYKSITAVAVKVDEKIKHQKEMKVRSKGAAMTV